MSNRVEVDLTVNGAPRQVITVGVLTQENIEGGVPANSITRVERYVLLSALPEEIQRRVVDALNFNRAGQVPGIVR
jgi:hypothetical protein